MRSCKLIAALLVAVLMVPSADAGSIWKKSKNSGRLNLFTTKEVVWRKHDLITILISESTSASHENDTATSKESSFASQILSFFRLDTSTRKFEPTATNPSWQMDSSQEFTGEGSSERKNNFTGQITAEIIEVLPNDNLVISSRKNIKINDDLQTLVLTGVVTPSDIGKERSVMSSKIFDINIEYLGEGPISDANKPGIITRLLNKIWPL